jgi:hypothetical protein
MVQLRGRLANRVTFFANGDQRLIERLADIPQTL